VASEVELVGTKATQQQAEHQGRRRTAPVPPVLSLEERLLRAAKMRG
jgi:hypothetical protein